LLIASTWLTALQDSLLQGKKYQGKLLKK